MSEVIGHVPMVSLLIAMRNEEGYIGRTIESLLTQDYPPDRLEILVYDGGSTDRSVAIATTLLRNRPMAKVLPNPGRIQSVGWNLGIDDAAGEIIGIVSAHCELAPDYVSKAVETLQRTGADMVGGIMHAIGESTVSRAVAVATSTPFGVGGARFHYAEREMDVDTVYMGLCRAETYRQFRFDEEMVRDQDDELSYRILDAGGRIVCNPAIRSEYHPRTSLRRLWSQYYQYGFWKVRVFRKHPRQIRPRQLVPPILVGTLATTGLAAAGSPRFRAAFLTSMGAYAIAATGASLRYGRLKRVRPVELLPVFATLHVAYGAGIWAGFIDALRREGPWTPRR
jgi:glycosyltransferase involved in cell wall biosynthesis